IGLAAPLVGDHVEGHALSLVEGLQAGLLDGADVDEDVRISAFGRDETISLLRVEELHCPGRHGHPLVSLRLRLARSRARGHGKNGQRMSHRRDRRRPVSWLARAAEAWEAPASTP